MCKARTGLETLSTVPDICDIFVNSDDTFQGADSDFWLLIFPLPYSHSTEHISACVQPAKSFHANKVLKSGL